MPGLRDVADAWRSGSHRSQTAVLLALVGGVTVSLVVSLVDYTVFPLAGFLLWLLLGSILLRFGPLVVLTVVVVAACVTARVVAQVEVGRVSGLVILLVFVLLVLYTASRQRAGLPGPLSEALLADLRDRLNAQGAVPPLPDGWRCETAMIAAHGVGYAGDFMVVDLDTETQRLDMVLVDVVGKGVKAAPSALLLAGALGGMIGALRGPAVLAAANAFLLRQDADETFATAVHVSVDLTTGRYVVHNAGHPPALHWSADAQAWEADESRGLALGVLADPDLHAAEGVLRPGEALMFYTDGVVESRSEDIEVGIEWLRRTAAEAFEQGMDGAARRVIARVPRGDDDRALLVLSRR
jgi:hypothetical protein